jgi:hypothetical protein|tara:strand:+ start:1445 stop:1642 length:198 start_codon:yes stop_codon:yes gene_type:complete
MNNKEILNNISKIQESRARNYFESKERFFLINILEKLQNNLDIKLNEDEVSLLKKIFQKYLKFVN